MSVSKGSCARGQKFLPRGKERYRKGERAWESDEVKELGERWETKRLVGSRCKRDDVDEQGQTQDARRRDFERIWTPRVAQ